MVKCLDEDKASRNELAYTEGLITSLNERVKHLASLLQQFAHNLIPSKGAINDMDDHS